MNPDSFDDLSMTMTILDTTFGLQGQTAFVTGAASGIGKSTARLLAQARARAVAADIESAIYNNAHCDSSKAGVNALMCTSTMEFADDPVA